MSNLKTQIVLLIIQNLNRLYPILAVPGVAQQVVKDGEACSVVELEQEIKAGNGRTPPFFVYAPHVENAFYGDAALFHGERHGFSVPADYLYRFRLIRVCFKHW